MISYYTTVHLSKCNGSWVVSTEQTMNFNIQTAAMLAFLFLTKMVLLEVVHHLKIYQYTKFHVLTLTGASFASTSEVWTSAILEWRCGIKNYGVEVTFNGMTSLLNFIKIYHLVQKLLGGTDRQTGDHISLTFLFKESRLKTAIRNECTKVHRTRTIKNTYINIKLEV
jgi:hypothetical protein